MKKLYITVLLFFTTSSLLFGQTGNLKFEHLSQFNSALIGYVNNIHQDSRGYIWINNISNLVRYDGYQTKRYFLRGANGQEADISSFAEDSKNGLYALGSNKGLFKYDITTDSFTYLHVASFAKNKSIYNASICIDTGKYVWILAYDYSNDAHRRKILLRFNMQTRKTETFNIGSQPDDPLYPYNEMFISASRNLWLPGANGLLEYNNADKNISTCFASDDTLKRKYVTTVYEAPSAKGKLWMVIKPSKKVKRTPELWCINEATKKAEFCADLPDSSKYPYDSGPFYTSQNTILEDPHKQLWITTFKCLFCYDPVTKRLVKYDLPATFESPKYQNIHGLVLDKNGIFWMPSFGLVSFDPKTASFKNYLANRSDPDALAHNHVTKLMLDHTGVLWAAMDEYGIDRVNTLKSAFKLYINNPHDPLSYPELVEGLFPGVGNDYFIATQNGVFNWETSKNQFKKINVRYRQLGYNDLPHSLVSKPDGTLYFLSWAGININYPDKRDKVIKLPSDFYYWSLIVDKAGKLWAINLEDDLVSLNADGSSLTHYHYLVKAPKILRNSYEGHAMMLDSRGRMWITNDTYGLCRVDTIKKSIVLFSGKQDLKKLSLVFAITEATDDKLWMAAYGGNIHLYDLKLKKIIKTLTISDDTLKALINSIAVDAAGKLWITTEQGLKKYDPVTGITYSYNSANGVSFDEPVGILKAADGNMVIGMANSAFIFNPDDIKLNLYPPQLAIENITCSDPTSKLNSKTRMEVADKSQIELTYAQNRITINYTGLHFVNPALNRYAYRLVGYENQWVQAGNNRSVTYNNLSPGTYTFKLIAANSDGVWSKVPAVVTIIISSPWWLRWWAWLIYIILFAAALYGFVTYRSRKLVRDKRLLEQQVAARTNELELSISHLKAAQTQLIQSEKMASLGELTAGIAHEIQNPLNFVNNFSEVSRELILEMKEELAVGHIADVNVIADDLNQNLEKINHHGKRAESIVKGMLEHSRTGSGVKEFTDLNRLSDEYLRMSYQGLRAKNKDYQVELVTNYDEKLAKVNVIAQDMGRVMLNLFNNAFYAVNQKSKTAGADYKPKVSVTTSVENAQATIKIKDNGIGMPDAIKEKIMQPFFTTKPTGEGTGLGLSLTYDMVVKGHGGTIQVNSVEGKGSEFIIQIPIK